MRKKFLTTLAVGICAFGLGAILAQAAAPPTPQGVITAKAFLNINGTAVSDLTSNAKFPNSPDIVAYPPYFELWATGDINTPAPGGPNYLNYGAQMVGYFYPDTTGDYTFYVCSDDASQLFLSTDTDPANKKLIAQETGWSGVRNYTGIGGGSTVEAKSSLTFTGTQWPVKDPAGGAKITLTKGQVYYIEALMKQGGGGDDLSVSIDSMGPIPGSMLSSFDKNTGPLTIVTQPQNVSINEGQPAPFTIVVDGTPPYTYQWQKNGAAITDATNSTYTIARAYRADTGAKFKVAITGANGSATSSEATLTVANDTTPPTLVSATSSATFDSVTVTFSEPLDPTSATLASNYKIDNGVTVSSAALGATAGTAGDNTVILTTTKQAAGLLFTLTVSNVKDVPGNTIVANSTVQFRSYVFTTGWCTYQRWNNDTTSLAAFETAVLDGTIGPPSVNSAITQFDGPWNVADNYKSRHFAWFVAPFSGNYVFFVSSDDGSDLFLSTDDTAANKKLIAKETGWSNEYQWTSVGSGTASEKRSDTFSAPEWPTGPTITLTKGNKYYIEILHTEGGGGDGAGATYIKEGDPNPPQNVSGMHLLGKVIGTYLDPAGASITITKQPADATGVDGKTTTVEGTPLFFAVSATGSSAYGNTVAYQWQKAAPGTSTFADIDGATSDSYSPPAVTMADSGTKFQVLCSVPALTVTSSVATLTVVLDTFPPKLVGATAFSGATKIGVAFDEDLDVTTAQTAANFKVNGTAVTSAVVRTNVANEKTNEKNLVQLTIPTAVTADFTLLVTGVKDVKGNAMADTTVTGKILNMTSTDIGSPAGQPGGPDPLVPSTVTAWGPGAFDVLCNGNDYWNNADGFNFVWEPKTNSFDVKVRVVSVSPIDNWTAGAIEIREGPVTPNGGGWELARHYFCKVDYGGEGVTVLDSTSAQGANQYEFNCRLAKGDPAQRETGNSGPGQSRGWANGSAILDLGSPGPPPWPNAWIRLKRVKQGTNDHLLGFTSGNGVVWNQRLEIDLNDANHAGFVGNDGQPAGKWPDVCYVGLGSTSHTGVGNNNQTNDGTTGEFWYSPVGQPYMAFVIYRDYGDVVEVVGPTLSAVRNTDGTVTITYTGTLYSADAVNGTYAAVQGAASPYKVNPATAGKPAQFYRSQ